MFLREKYFAAANTSAGFVSFFDRIFDPSLLSRLYIIKSGAGTGKSTMIKRTADAAESCGHKVLYFYCSSDPDSLDGILIPSLSFGLTDGTAPHMTDPKYPCAADALLDFYPYLDENKLYHNRAKIIALTDENKAYHKKSSAYRRYAGLAGREALSVVVGCTDGEKLDSAVKRCAASVKDADGKAEHRQISAFSVRGRVRFDTYEQMSEKITAVCDEHGSAYIFMNGLRSALMEKGAGFYYSTDTLLPENCEAIYIPKTKECFVITGKASKTDRTEYTKVINMKRFINASGLKEVRGRLRMCEKTRDMLDCEAERLIAAAGRVHDGLEEIYKNAVDFDGVRALTDKMIRKYVIRNS